MIDTYDEDLAAAMERVSSVRAWANSRIAYCERTIAALPTDSEGEIKPAYVVEYTRRQQERQSLIAVLNMIDGKLVKP